MDDFANTCWYIAWVRELREECVFRFGEQRVAGYSSDAHYQRLNVLYRIADTGIDGPTSREHPTVWLNMARAEAKGLDYSHEPDAHKAYRDYVAYQWRYVDKRPCVWSYRDPPEFVIDDLPADFPKDLL